MQYLHLQYTHVHTYVYDIVLTYLNLFKYYPVQLCPPSTLTLDPPLDSTYIHFHCS